MIQNQTLINSSSATWTIAQEYHLHQQYIPKRIANRPPRIKIPRVKFVIRSVSRSRSQPVQQQASQPAAVETASGVQNVQTELTNGQPLLNGRGKQAASDQSGENTQRELWKCRSMPHPA
ncbi:hypothetical protein MP228_004292 [Amoeboaphelidium protococcarum]|nr:hypothetical protein MP228_004292 [Amoeboaphelidium protococcarum]